MLFVFLGVGKFICRVSSPILWKSFSLLPHSLCFLSLWSFFDLAGGKKESAVNQPSPLGTCLSARH